MTLVVGWIGLDDKKDKTGKAIKSIASVYFASDSRYSWNNGKSYFDYGQKLWRCRRFPEMFCYCGDVIFPTTALGKLTDEIDSGILFEPDCNAEEKFRIVGQWLSAIFNAYPKGALTDNVNRIYYATKSKKEISICQYEYKEGKPLSLAIKEIDEEHTFFSDGSGNVDFKHYLDSENQASKNNANTSRAVFHAFCMTLKGSNVSTVGGVPQLMGMFRGIDTVQIFGYIDENKNLFVNGCSVEGIVSDDNLSRIQWHNCNFENMNPHTRVILIGAQRQPF